MILGIKTVNLRKEYKDIVAVENLNLDIKKGEFFSLLGVNGAGKTTAIKMMSGITQPTTGDAFICSHSVVKEPLKAKKHISVSPQETAVALKLTTIENLEMICGLYGFDKKTSKEKACEIIRRFKMDQIKHKRAEKLSGGWQRRLSIAMALITEPDVMFLDEPSLGLDVMARRELWSLIESLKGKITIILTTHYLEEAQALSDRIGIMSNGKLKAIGTVNELVELSGKEKFEDAFIELCTKEAEI